MANQGAHIRDIHSLEELDEVIKQTGEKMANIEQEVSNYLYSVKEDLDEQLDFLREKMEEAEAKWEEAKAALSQCHASQVYVPEMGGYVPTCISEEVEERSAREEAKKWREKFQKGQQIVRDCQQEISNYNSSDGGHGLIMNMVNNQTPKASENLRNCINKLQDILATDFHSLQSNLDVTFNGGAYTSPKSQFGDGRLDAFRNNIQKKKE